MDLRLFPLANVVLFPGMELPLQVFEPRYRLLVTECVRNSEPFGVTLIREGVEVGGPAVPYDVGTTAIIKSAAVGPDGLIHLATVGSRRFRVVALHDDRPYLWADVEYLPDEPAEVPHALVEHARAGLARIARLHSTATGEYEREPKVPHSPGALADTIAALATSPPDDLQRLLETSDVRARLESVIPLLDELLTVAERRCAQAVAARWRAFGMQN